MSYRAGNLQSALTYCVEFACEMLRQAGEFYPFGAVVARDGEVNALAGWDGDEHSRAADLYQMLIDELSDNAGQGEIAGAAIAVNVNMPGNLAAKWPDGIRVRLESAGNAQLVYVPYRLEPEIWWRRLMGNPRKVVMADPIVLNAQPEVFVN
ncbi:hypothetical protein GTZ99_01280 [Novosphingobium sp. FSY-8]|uniref:Uncharacterized protein n=1 Tax=Novosphingobium ovatum TaxID=1908523 RepID=A0ABW9X9I1_9SPHN|nr:hypothetical protein [Novosphingobium ovatum]NBC35187.1 hypothetical protein [Novosphingobium ovatum]